MKAIRKLALIIALLLFPVVVYGQMAPGTINARQTGTWTIQPGNTANTTAWLVTGTGGTFPATQSGTWTVQPGNTANTTAWLVTGTGGTFPTTPAALTSLATGQQAVTATAAVLPTSTAKNVCIKVLIAGTQAVYYGPTGVTTSTGQELSAGDTSCMALDNVNRIFVIAAGTGSTVAWQALN